ncbi:MAG: type II secretion system F family protein [Lachnospiraceae bacterium]|nr:type II secretion system F family protein [Lachnospiraceae bacterium]
MEIIFVICLLGQLLTGFLARNEATEKKFLLKSAQFLYRKIFKNLFAKTIMHRKIEKNITSLNPGKSKELLTAMYYIEKIRITLALCLVGNLLALILSLSISTSLVNGLLLPKNNWKDGSYFLDLSVTPQDSESKPHQITIEVSPISLNAEEAEILANEVFEKLLTLILGKNESLNQVTDNLNLMKRLNGYPFTIKWVSDKPSLVRHDGVTNNLKVLSGSGEIVKLTATLTYQDQWAEYQFSEDIFVNLLPYLVAEDDSFEEPIMEAIRNSQQKNANSDYLRLPEAVRGTAVSYQEIKAKDSLYLWLMILVVAFLFFAVRDHELQKKVSLRNQQIERSYPDLVRKLALYIGAGLTLRGAFKRVAGESSSNVKAKYLHQEMLYSVRELDNGIPEREVYERFGKRLGIARYRRLTGILCNHLEKGNKNLLAVLREETELVLLDRRKAARVIGEEMGTKLLLPMMMMLLVVMIMIMVPAFMMF